MYTKNAKTSKPQLRDHDGNKLPTVPDARVTNYYFHLLNLYKWEHTLSLHHKTWADRMKVTADKEQETGYNLPLLLEKCPAFAYAAQEFIREEWWRAGICASKLFSNYEAPAQLHEFAIAYHEYLVPNASDLQAGCRYRFFKGYKTHEIDAIRAQLQGVLKHEVTDGLIWALVREVVQSPKYNKITKQQLVYSQGNITHNSQQA